MPGSTDIDPGRFITSVKPLLEANDVTGLLSHLNEHWSPDQILNLLDSPHRDARKVASLALALVGGKCCIPALAQRLSDTDVLTNQLAEHALWSIWFRCGTPLANVELARGAQCLSDRNFDCALEHFSRALEYCPDLAEAYNQRAITWYLLEEFEKSAADCRRAIELMPCHFGAWAGLGHSHAHQGRLAEAIACYEHALAINPHLDCIRQAISELRRPGRHEGQD